MTTLLFDIEDFTDTKSKQLIEEKLKELTEEDKPGKYCVILHNDPINGVEYVTKIIKEVFGYSTSKAIWLMLKAHFTGKSILWQGRHKEASNKQQKMIAYGPDPLMLHKGAKALKVSIEKHE